MKRDVLIAVGVVAVLIGVVWLLSSLLVTRVDNSRDKCEAQHGTLVRGPGGLVCIDARQINIK